MRDSEYYNYGEAHPSSSRGQSESGGEPDTHVVVVRVTSVNTYATVVSADNDWEAVERVVGGLYMREPHDTVEVVAVIKL